jgi:hypothetical protein
MLCRGGGEMVGVDTRGVDSRITLMQHDSRNPESVKA